MPGLIWSETSLTISASSLKLFMFHSADGNTLFLLFPRPAPSTSKCPWARSWRYVCMCDCFSESQLLSTAHLNSHLYCQTFLWCDDHKFKALRKDAAWGAKLGWLQGLNHISCSGNILTWLEKLSVSPWTASLRLVLETTEQLCSSTCQIFPILFTLHPVRFHYLFIHLIFSRFLKIFFYIC